MIVYLIGMPGCGKSKCGRELADLMNYSFVDLDKYVEEKTNKSIENIFIDDGEAFFREQERQALLDLSDKKDLIVATGGGIVNDFANKELMRNGIVIYLNTSLNDIKEHLENSKSVRPLLNKYSLAELYDLRKNKYLAFMDYQVNYEDYLKASRKCQKIVLGYHRHRVLVVNGPNLNMLGFRNPIHYGKLSLNEINELIVQKTFFDYEFYQSNHEGDIIDKLQNYKEYDGIIINAGAYTHTSLAIHDALEIIDLPKIEVHLSEVDNREDYRKINYLRDVCDKCFAGKKADSYLEAIEYLKSILNVV